MRRKNSAHYNQNSKVWKVAWSPIYVVKLIKSRPKIAVQIFSSRWATSKDFIRAIPSYPIYNIFFSAGYPYTEIYTLLQTKIVIAEVLSMSLLFEWIAKVAVKTISLVAFSV